mgnify:CR=1 FL=1
MSANIGPLTSVTSVHPSAMQPTAPIAAASVVVQPAAPSSETTNQQPRAQQRPPAHELNKDISFDQSGLVVVRTVESLSREVVAQMPSEAYLRLAQAMQETIEADMRTTHAAGVVA